MGFGGCYLYTHSPWCIIHTCILNILFRQNYLKFEVLQLHTFCVFSGIVKRYNFKVK